MLLQRSLKPTINDNSGYLFNSYSLIRAVHTAVKGRVRFKVNGLYRCAALKKYLEIRLSKLDVITQASANPVTGNVLVMFDPNFTLDAIASLLQDIVLDYRKVSVNLPIVAQSTTKLVHQPQSDNVIPCLATATILTSSAGLLFRYGLDESILLAIQKLHNPLLDRIMQSITLLGEPLPLLFISSGFGLQLWHNHRRQEATTLGIATTGAIGLNYLLKELFARARPALWDYIVHAVHYSFPSGHAMVSTAVYGYIGYALTKEFPQWREPILASTVILILAIGFSRLYLGVHWPTDVLVGYAAGLLWLMVCISIFRVSQQQRIIGEDRERI